MGIIKFVKGEMKKTFLKPGIFVVTLLLVIALSVSALLFKPENRKSDIIELTYNSYTTVNDLYSTTFISSDANNQYSKNYFENRYINPARNNITNYKTELNNAVNSKINELSGIIDTMIADYTGISGYRNLALNSDGKVSELQKDEAKKKLKDDLQNFKTTFSAYVEGDIDFFYLLLDKDVKTDVDVFIASIESSIFSDSVTIEHVAVVNKIEEMDIFNTLEGFVSQIKPFSPSAESVIEAENYLNKSIENLNEIENEILTFYLENPSDNSKDAKENYLLLLTKYQQTSINAYNLVTLTINEDALKDYSDNEIQEFYQFKNYNYKTKYEIREAKTVCKYYLDTKQYPFEFATPLSLSKSSNVDTSVYDFMFFALSICSFIIIIYVVYLGATMITGEYAAGTMKLLAIRPYSRRKILFGKLLSTIFIGLLFLILTFIVTFIIGGIVYSPTSLSILVIFNSDKIFSASGFVVILIFFLCKLIEMMFYAILSISISTIFKSNTGSVILSMLVYFVSFILSIFTTSLGFLKYLPFVNTNLFGYFGSHISSSTMSTSYIDSMFSSVIANDMNFYISLAIILAFSIIIYTITSYVFRKRDIK